MSANHVLVLPVGKDRSAEVSERYCSKVNHPDPRQEKRNNSKEVLLLVISTLETQIMGCVYKNEAVIFH